MLRTIYLKIFISNTLKTVNSFNFLTFSCPFGNYCCHCDILRELSEIVFVWVPPFMLLADKMQCIEFDATILYMRFWYIYCGFLVPRPSLMVTGAINLVCM